MSSWSILWDSLRRATSGALVLAAGPSARRALGHYMERTGGDYIDARVVAETLRVSRSAAKTKLDRAVARGELEKVFLYVGADAPAPIVISKAEIDTRIKLRDAGFVENADEEIQLRLIHIKEVYCVPAAS